MFLVIILLYLEDILPDQAQLMNLVVRLAQVLLALQIIPGLNSNVLYVSAEESEDQLALRAKRLGIDSKLIHLSTENNAQVILDQVAVLKPKLLI